MKLNKRFRIIKDGSFYKIQQEIRLLWFKPKWKTLQKEIYTFDTYEYVDYIFETVADAKQFIKNTFLNIPDVVKIIASFEDLEYEESDFNIDNKARKTLG